MLRNTKVERQKEIHLTISVTYSFKFGISIIRVKMLRNTKVERQKEIHLTISVTYTFKFGISFVIRTFSYYYTINILVCCRWNSKIVFVYITSWIILDIQASNCNPSEYAFLVITMFECYKYI